MAESNNQDQLAKKVEWLDNERRGDKTLIAALQSKVENVDAENSAMRLRISEMESEITRLNTLLARLEQFDSDISSMRTDTTRQLDSFKETVRERAVQTETHKHEIDSLNQSLTEVRKKLTEIDPLKDLLEDRQAEDLRLASQIEALKSQLNAIESFDEDYKRSLRIIEESRRQDTKRLTDTQGEVSALRKRQDESRGKQDLVSDNLRKMELRIKDLLDAESERRESQTAFMEKINLTQVERDRVFKDWAARFTSMETIMTGLEEEVTNLENTHRSVKQSQAVLDDVSQRFDRRINEITEVQRLGEDRFRQEWTTFKSDDQKRWANYTLSQEEQHREMNRSLDGLSERILTTEELLAEMADRLSLQGKEDLRRMMAILNNLRDSVEVYNDLFQD